MSIRRFRTMRGMLAFTAPAIAAAAGLATAPARAVPTAASWNNAAGGNWNTAGNWSGALVPNNTLVPAREFNVTVSLAGAYTITHNTSTTIQTLVLNNATATINHTLNAFNVLGLTTITAGTYRHSGGTSSFAGGVTLGSAGVLEGNGTVDVQGSFVSSGTIRALSGGTLVFTSGGGAAGIWNIDQAGATVAVDATNGSVTFTGTLNDPFDGRTINVGSGRTFSVTGGWTFDSGNVNLTGGTLGGGAFTMTGGTITATGSSSIGAPATLTGGNINVTNAGDTLSMGGFTTYNGATFGGAGTLAQLANATYTGTTIINTDTYDWDGSGIAGNSRTINAGATLTINSNTIDAGNNFYDSILTNNGTLNVNTTSGWTMSSSSTLNLGAGSVINGSALAIEGTVDVNGSAIINAAVTFDATPGITLSAAADTLRLAGGSTWNGGTINQAGVLSLDGNTTIAANTTFTSRLDWDGTTVGADTFRVNANVTATIASDQSGDSYNDNILLDGGFLDVSNGAGWTMTGTLTMQSSGAFVATLDGGPLTFNFANVVASGAGLQSIQSDSTTWTNSTATIGAGTVLALTSETGPQFNSLTTSGAGTFSINGGATYNGVVTFGNAFLDWDGPGTTGQTHTVTTTGNLTINADITDAFSDNLTIVDGGQVTVNSPSGSWTLDSGREIFLNNTAAFGSPTLGGTARLFANGTIRAVGIGSISAPVTFDATPDIILANASDRLNLQGGQTFNGGTINQAGVLSLDGNTIIAANTTFTSRLDWDGTFLAVDDTFTVNSGVTATISSDQSGDDYNDNIILDGTLNVNGPAAWVLGPGGELWLRNNGGTSGVLNGQALTVESGGLVRSSNGGPTDINVPITFAAGSSSVVEAIADRLNLNGAITFEGGSHTGNGTLRLEGNANVTANTTIDTRTLDWDGFAIFGATTIASGVTFTINSLFIDDEGPGDGFEGVLNLNNATLAVNSPGGWIVGPQTATINMNGAAPTINGTAMTVLAADINVNSAFANINAPVNFRSGANVVVGAGNRLRLNGATDYSGGAYTGAGEIEQNGNATISGNTAIGVNTFDWDGEVGGDTVTTVNAGATFTINSAFIESDPNRLYDGTTNTAGILRVNTAGGWLNNGTVNLTNNAARLEGTAVTNTGTISGFGTLANASIDNNGTISAIGGTLNINTTAFSDLDGSGEAGILNAVNGDLRILGNFGTEFVYDGAINIGSARTFTMANFGIFNQGAMNMNNGTYQAPAFIQNAGTLTVSGISTINAASVFDGGTTTIGANSDLRIVGSARLNAAATINGAANSRFVVRSGAVADGNGTVGTNLRNEGAIRPGNGVGAIGTLSAASFTQVAGASATFEFTNDTAAGGDRLTITGAASLAGTLNLSLVGGFAPQWGDSWTIMTYASRTGDFSSFSASALGANLFWWREVNAANYRVGVRLAGDLDHNGIVDFFDLNQVLAFYGQVAAINFGIPGAGDTNEDGIVDFFDLNNVLAFYGQSAPLLAVPAPGLAGVLVGLGVIGARRRRAN